MEREDLVTNKEVQIQKIIFRPYFTINLLLQVLQLTLCWTEKVDGHGSVLQQLSIEQYILLISFFHLL